MLNKSLIALNMINGLGSTRIKQLLDYFKTPEKIFKASLKDLSRVEGVGPRSARSILEQKENLDLDAELKLIEQNKIEIITYLDDEYPSYLKEIYDPPIVLYVKGEILPQDDVSIAIVGSRRASFYGVSCAEKIAAQLAQLGITVVSGLARGIDTAAHKGVLKGGGRTIAVLGSGLGNIYPAENKDLSEDIAKNGAVVSELPFYAVPLAGNFPRRNRIISGLSQGVVIAEAAKRSGALITANFALEQGREVFAVPGKLDSFTSMGTNKLIKQGAKLVQDIDDIIEELNLKVVKSKESGERKFNTDSRAISLEAPEKDLYDLILDEPVYIDNLIDKTGISIQNISRILLTLQLKHLVRELPGKNFVRVCNG